MKYKKKKKERKGSRCETQNMAGKVSIVLASSLILLHNLLEPFSQALGVTASDLEHEELPLKEPLWVGNILETFYSIIFCERREKRESSEWMCTYDPRLELEVYFSVEIFSAMVFSFHSTYLF